MGFNILSTLHPVNYREAVLIDPDDLIDSRQVAEMLGLSSHRAVSVYRSRYDDFPRPLVIRSEGQCTLWHRPEVEAWLGRRRRGG
jgi:predicted DNA-binding transcriptional regulator AlpA